MPSSHTARVLEGCSPEEFIWDCARSFVPGAQDMDWKALKDYKATVPSDIVEQVKAAQLRQKEIAGLSPSQIVERVNQINAEMAEHYQTLQTENLDTTAKYSAMLDGIKKFNLGPDRKAITFTKFLQTQLEESIRFDCFNKSETDSFLTPNQLTPSLWHKMEMDESVRSVQRAIQRYQTIVREVNETNEFLDSIRAAIAAM